MSRNLPTSLIEPMCSPTWVAKAYSEYMYDCAAAQATLIGTITDAAADEALDIASEQAIDYWQDKSDQILDVLHSTNDSVDAVVNSSIFDDQALSELDMIEQDQSDPRHNQIEALLESLGDRNDEVMEALMDETSWSQIIVNYGGNLYAKSFDDVLSATNTVIQTALSNLHYQEGSPITLDEGAISAKELFQGMIADINGWLKNGFDQKLTKYNGTLTDVVQLNSEKVFEQLKSSLASASAWGAGFAAIAKETISDRLAYFEAQILTVIADTTEKFANTVQTVKSKLANAKNDVRDFFAMAADELGWSQIGDDTFQTVDATDVYAYTGASPLSSINTKGLSGLVNATVKTVCAVGYGIFSAAKNILCRLWRKVSPFVKALTNDPVDIGVCNKSDESYACSNFKSQGQATLQLDTDYDSAVLMKQAILGKLNNWVALETYFGELNFRISDFLISASGLSTLYVDYEYRPRCMNYRKAIDCNLIRKHYINGHTYVLLDAITAGNMPAWDALLSTEYRPEDDEDEKYLYMGFWMANAMMIRLVSQTLVDLVDWIENENPGFFMPTIYAFDGNQRSQLDYVHYLPAYHIGTTDSYVPDHVTNLDFIQATSGFHDFGHDVHTFSMFPSGEINDLDPNYNNNAFITTDQIIGVLATLWIGQQVDRLNHPTEYLFIPYCNGSYDFSEGRFKIKTDAQNANIASIIAQALIVVAVVLAAVFVCKTVLQIIKKKKIAKLSAKVGVMDNAMWNGKKLNTTEALKYTRWKNKLSKIEGASSGLAGAGSKISALTDTIGKVQSTLVPTNANSVESSDNIGVAIYKLIR